MSEYQLIERARSGDESAFAELIEQNQTRMFNVCLRVTANHHDAEDAFAGAVYLAWKNLDKFHGDAGFGTWVYRIASNAAMDIVRRRKAAVSIDASLPGSEDDDTPVLQLESKEADFAETVAQNDALTAALGQLPEQSREAIVLAEVAGLTLSEIAEHQGASLSATKVRVHRARKTLRELLS